MGNVYADGLKDHPVLDVPYTWRFFSFLSPLHINLAARLSGANTPDLDGHFTYCDIGCGNGVTPNTLAACYPRGEFLAIDLNAEHIANGHTLADKGGMTNIRFMETTFEDALKQPLPKFDYMVVHGVYSWVSSEVRSDIRALVQRFLKEEGLLLISYNNMAGWSHHLPIREFLRVLSAGKEGDTGARIHAALRDLQRLAGEKVAYFERTPSSVKLLEHLLTQSPGYLAHEYLNESWQPQFFAEVIEEFEEIDMAFCGTADLAWRSEHDKILDTLGSVIDFPEDLKERESLASLTACKNFRCDVFCRREQHDSGMGKQALDDLVFGGSLSGGPGQSQLPKGDPNLLRGLLPNILRPDRSLAEIKSLPPLQSFADDVVDNCICDLICAGIIQPFAQSTHASPMPEGQTIRIDNAFNLTLLRERLFKDPVLFLASPVLGNGLRITPIHGLLLLATHEAGLPNATSWIWDYTNRIGQPVMCNDRKIENLESLRNYLSKEIEVFKTKWLPVLIQLGVATPCPLAEGQGLVAAAS